MADYDTSLSDSERLWWVTRHVQKDGRVNLGTAVHADPECVALRGREFFSISGTVTNQVKRCGKCSRRSKKD